MPKITDRIPDGHWRSAIAAWLKETGELLFVFSIAGGAGSRGYLFCRTLDDVALTVDRLSRGARIKAYRRHSLGLRSMVTDAFVQAAMAQIPDGHDFLLIRTSPREYDGFGLSGHCGNSHADLEEYLQDHLGEEVRLGGDPDRENGDDGVLVVYKDGLIGAY